MGIALIVISIPLLVFAIVLSKGEGIAMIAGYNTMSDEKRAQYDEIALCKFMGKAMYGVCISFWIAALGEMVSNQTIILIGMGFSIALAIFSIIYTNPRSDRFKKNATLNESCSTDET